jgi:hypothetical protein
MPHFSYWMGPKELFFVRRSRWVLAIIRKHPRYSYLYILSKMEILKLDPKINKLFHVSKSEVHGGVNLGNPFIIFIALSTIISFSWKPHGLEGWCIWAQSHWATGRPKTLFLAHCQPWFLLRHRRGPPLCKDFQVQSKFWLGPPIQAMATSTQAPLRTFQC